MSSVTLAAAPGRRAQAHAPRVSRRAQRLPLQVRADAAPQVRWQTMQVALKVRARATRCSCVFTSRRRIWPHNDALGAAARGSRGAAYLQQLQAPPRTRCTAHGALGRTALALPPPLH